MNKRPGHVVVTTEVAVCSFCGRPRTLRNEQHQLGALVRTIVTCETCHRTLSSSISVATVEPTAIEPETAAEPAAAAQPAKTPQVEAAAKPAAKAPTQRKPSATAAKATASKSRTKKKTR
jgi:hypothetical protein